MMIARSLLLAVALLAANSATAFAQASEETIVAPVLRANVTVESDVVRIGDMIDNAGTSAQIAIYRAPDLGTTGSSAESSAHRGAASASGDRCRSQRHQGENRDRLS